MWEWWESSTTTPPSATRSSFRWSSKASRSVFSRAPPTCCTPATLRDFDCLVIDQNMPRMNGIDLVAKLRDLHCSAPVVLITSDPPKALVARAGRAGVLIVEKPLLGNTLLDTIHEWSPPGRHRGERNDAASPRLWC